MWGINLERSCFNRDTSKGAYEQWEQELWKEVNPEESLPLKAAAQGRSRK